MNKFIIFVSCFLFICIQNIFAQQPSSKPVGTLVQHRTVPLTPSVRSNLLAKTGGLIQTKANGPAILFLNTQTTVPESVICRPSVLIHQILHLPCEIINEPSEKPIAAAILALARTNVASVIVIGDVSGYPSILVAPESRWALVNIAALETDSPAPSLLAERTHKETVRAFGLLMGAANSTFDACLLKPVFSISDLDLLTAKFISPDVLNKVFMHAQKLGIKPVRQTTYRKAVEEGWAPAPTNVFQRAVWNELKK